MEARKMIRNSRNNHGMTTQPKLPVMIREALIFVATMLFAMYGVTGQVQGPEIRFESPEHDYGDIREEGGVAKHTFWFTNVGDDTLVLTRVQPGCGCTASDYTKTPLLPGERGFVTADYDPRNRPGPFRKHILVVSNSRVSPNLSIFIKGNVIPRTRDYTDTFRVQLGDFLFDRNNPVFHNMRHDEVRSDTVRFINISDKTVTISVDEAPTHISVTISAPRIGPKQRGFVVLRYDANGINASGNRHDRIFLQTNDIKLERKLLFVTSQVLERPAERPLDQVYPFVLGNMRMSRNALSFHNILNTETRTDSIILYNSGERPMRIDIQKPADYIKTSLSKHVLSPGETATLRVSYDASGVGAFGLRSNDRIMLQTDDETQPIKVVYLSAEIKEDFSHLTPQQRAIAPVISFGQTEYDFGTQTSGQQVRHSFTFTNNGKSELIIRRVNAGCGCTATAPAKTNLQPGETSQIDVTFNTTGRRGNQNMRVTVVSNDPNIPEVYLTLKGVLE
jgi:hypothetical protein